MSKCNGTNLTADSSLEKDEKGSDSATTVKIPNLNSDEEMEIKKKDKDNIIDDVDPQGTKVFLSWSRKHICFIGDAFALLVAFALCLILGSTLAYSRYHEKYGTPTYAPTKISNLRTMTISPASMSSLIDESNP